MESEIKRKKLNKIKNYKETNFYQIFKQKIPTQSIEDYFLYLRIHNLLYKQPTFSYLSKINPQKLISDLLDRTIKRNPYLRIPTEFNGGYRYSTKIFIPVEEHPEINFIGHLIGPSGRSLQMLEQQKGIKISIRGRGAFGDESDEPLHCFVAADTKERYEQGVEEVNKIIKDAIELPENENIVKREQLEEMGYFKKDLKISNLTDWEKYYYWWYYFNKVEKNKKY